MHPDTCVANGEECPFYCPNTPPTECGQGMMSCPGPVDGMGCKSPATCVSYGEECPFFCPFVAPVDCGDGMQESRHLCLLRRGMSFLLSLRRPCGLRRGDDELPGTDGRDGMHDRLTLAWPP